MYSLYIYLRVLDKNKKYEAKIQVIKWNKLLPVLFGFQLNPAFIIGVKIIFIAIIFNIFIVLTSVVKCLPWLIYISKDNLLDDVITVEYLIDVESKFEMEFYAAFLVFKGLHIIIQNSKAHSEPSQKSKVDSYICGKS